MKYQEIIDYIENFDKKKINISFLTTHGRSGSHLLQSLIDNHEEILQIPTIFSYYYEWEVCYKNLENNPEKLVNAFFNQSTFCYHYNGLDGKYKNKEFYALIDLLKSILLDVLPELKEINRKTFLLALHFAWAKAVNLDFSKIKAISQHHHSGVISSYSYNYPASIEKYLDRMLLFTKISTNDFILQNLLNDFPQAKILHVIRKPFDDYCSILTSLKKVEKDFLRTILGGLLSQFFFGYHYGLVEKSILKENYKFVRFEDMHLDTETTMRDVADFLGVEFNNNLLISTYGGELWWGNNPCRLINGTSPDMINDKWKKKLDPHSKAICVNLLNPIATKYGYERYEPDDFTGNIYNFLPIEKKNYLLFLPYNVLGLGKISYYIKKPSKFIYKLIFLILGWLINPVYWIKEIKKPFDNLVFWLRYPVVRKKLISHFYNLGKKLDECDSYLDYGSFWVRENNNR